MAYALLNTLHSPVDLRALPVAQLPALCAELRAFLQNQTQTKEGHIKSSLGVTELTVALHFVFNTPKDILIWDVGHQAYVHKIITDRKNKFATNRKKGGLSGFTSRKESPYDPFGAGHSSTSVSALTGFWKAAQISKVQRQHLAVIGDGALTGGMAFEALNYLGEQGANCLIILNDNQSSIDPNVGALQKNNSYAQFAQSLGFQYFEEAAGNSAASLVQTLTKLKNTSGPKFLKVRTQKGLGYRPQPPAPAAEPETTFQSVFGQEVMALLRQNPKLVVISPAMLSGANLAAVKKAFPKRVLDVGIAEQNAVTMAAGLAADGYFPLIHLYSTFAQRAIDQIIHDLALQNLPALICLDRAGIVGADGPTHHGAFDVSLLSSLPHLEMMAPGTALNFKNQLREAITKALCTVIRYPKDAIGFEQSPLKNDHTQKPHWWKKGKRKCVVSSGSLAAEAQHAVVDTSFAHLHVPALRPFPAQELQNLLAGFDEIVSVEENMAAGGLGSQLQGQYAAGLLKGSHQVLSLPAKFVSHGTRPQLLEEVGLSAAAIFKKLQD
jgi:1-deoxy-D-xylulose-5-phosphate synthase